VPGEERHPRFTADQGAAAGGSRGETAVSPAPPPQRIVTRLVLEFLVEVVAAATRAHNGDLKAMLVFMAIQHANIEHLESDSGGTQTKFLGYPDDALRRPITVHALSQSLNMPPETGRRHTQALVRRGCCERVGDRGLIVPSRVMARAPFADTERQTSEAFVKLLSNLHAVGFDVRAAAGVRQSSPPTQRAMDPANANHAISVLATGYMLRVIIDGIPLHDSNYVRALLFITVMTMNVSHIAHDPKQAWRYADAHNVPPDDMRKPVSVRAVSERLGLPYETTRLHLKRMVGHGEIVRMRGGLITPAAALQDPERLKRGLNVHVWFLRAVAQLHSLGFDFEAAVQPARSSR
jgi:hypothetical protein